MIIIYFGDAGISKKTSRNQSHATFTDAPLSPIKEAYYGQFNRLSDNGNMAADGHGLLPLSVLTGLSFNGRLKLYLTAIYRSLIVY